MVTLARYNTSGNWYKGNTHIHSNASDGAMSFPEIAAKYAEAGYDFLFRTDHWVASDVASDTKEHPLLWLDGIELDGPDSTGCAYHVACFGTFKGLSREMGLNDAMKAVTEQGGLRILAHPHWMGNSLEDALRWNFDGVEIYNNVCWGLNGKGNSEVHWEAMLRRSPGTIGLAADDSHLGKGHPWNGGWIVINAPELTRDNVMAAIRSGNFYSSQGPQFHSIELDGLHVEAKTSPVERAWLTGPWTCGIRLVATTDNPLTELAFDIPENWPYAFIKLEDADGRQAWTNTL